LLTVQANPHAKRCATITEMTNVGSTNRSSSCPQKNPILKAYHATKDCGPSHFHSGRDSDTKHRLSLKMFFHEGAARVRFQIAFESATVHKPETRRINPPRGGERRNWWTQARAYRTYVLQNGLPYFEDFQLFARDQRRQLNDKIFENRD